MSGNSGRGGIDLGGHRGKIGRDSCDWKNKKVLDGARRERNNFGKTLSKERKEIGKSRGVSFDIGIDDLAVA